MAIQITDDTLEQVLGAKEITVIDFWAAWCKPCVALGPIIEDLSVKYKDNASVSIGKVDVDSNVGAAKRFGIRSIPTILFFKDGLVVDKFVGGKTAKEIQDKVESLLV